MRVCVYVCVCVCVCVCVYVCVYVCMFPLFSTIRAAVFYGGILIMAVTFLGLTFIPKVYNNELELTADKVSWLPWIVKTESLLKVDNTSHSSSTL